MFPLLAGTDNMNLPFKRPKLQAQPPAHPGLPEAPSPRLPSAEEGDGEGVSGHLPSQCAMRARPRGPSSSRERRRGI